METASRTGMDSVRCNALALGSVPAAYAGDAEAARSMASEALALAAATGYGIGSIWARWRSRSCRSRSAIQRPPTLRSPR